jgi:hypothetical protein
MDGYPSISTRLFHDWVTHHQRANVGAAYCQRYWWRDRCWRHDVYAAEQTMNAMLAKEGHEPLTIRKVNGRYGAYQR